MDGPVRHRVGQGLLVVAGLVNALPGAGAFFVERARSAYGVGVDDRSVDVLLQHRAVLFLIVGGGLLVAVARPRLRAAAVTANMASCAGFVAVVLVNRPVSAELARVAWVDLGLLLVLGVGARLTSGPTVRPRSARG